MLPQKVLATTLLALQVFVASSYATWLSNILSYFLTYDSEGLPPFKESIDHDLPAMMLSTTETLAVAYDSDNLLQLHKV